MVDWTGARETVDWLSIGDCANWGDLCRGSGPSLGQFELPSDLSRFQACKATGRRSLKAWTATRMQPMLPKFCRYLIPRTWAWTFSIWRHFNGTGSNPGPATLSPVAPFVRLSTFSIVVEVVVVLEIDSGGTSPKQTVMSHTCLDTHRLVRYYHLVS